MTLAKKYLKICFLHNSANIFLYFVIIYSQAPPKNSKFDYDKFLFQMICNRKIICWSNLSGFVYKFQLKFSKCLISQLTKISSEQPQNICPENHTVIFLQIFQKYSFTMSAYVLSRTNYFFRCRPICEMNRC